MNRALSGKQPRHSHGKMGRQKARCQFEKCNKLAKDFIDGKPLCRIHSPMREGYIFKEKKVKKR